MLKRFLALICLLTVALCGCARAELAVDIEEDVLLT